MTRLARFGGSRRNPPRTRAQPDVLKGPRCGIEPPTVSLRIMRSDPIHGRNLSSEAAACPGDSPYMAWATRLLHLLLIALFITAHLSAVKLAPPIQTN